MPTPTHRYEGSPDLSTNHTLVRHKHSSLANISVPSFSAFRAQASSIPVASPVRRKPLPENTSARVNSSSFANLASPRPQDVDIGNRPYSAESPLPREANNGLANVLSPPLTADLEQSVRNRFRRLRRETLLISGDRKLHGHTHHKPHDRTISIGSRLSGQEADLQRRAVSGSSTSPRSSIPIPLNHDKDINVYTGRKSSLTRLASDAPTPSKRLSRTITTTTTTTTKPLPMAPDMAHHQDGLPRSISDMSLGSTQSGTSPMKKKNQFTSFFGWKSSRPYENESPTTVFSDHDMSPSTSPSLARLPQMDGAALQAKLTQSALDVQRANDASGTLYFDQSDTPFMNRKPVNNAHVEELERELREVSSELAGSIRREMDLEDEIERCKDQIPNGLSELTRRTSDYYSDSGASSARFPLGEGDNKLDELEKSKRRLEQEKGQVRAEYSQKLADELRKRRELEQQVQSLQQQLEEGQAKVNQGQENDVRVRELEVHLKDSQRRLSQERQSRDNFEDLLAALREELEQHRNDRDNLRDEVVPQLKSRIEGLETEAAEVSTLRYENARMQQEIRILKGEDTDAPGTPSGSRFRSISEEDGQPAKGWGLNRSNSVARTPANNGGLKRGMSLSRSASVKDRQNNARHPSDNDHVRDVEDQRDALHMTLRNLLRRHELQKREHTKAISKLVADRNRAKNLNPGRSHFARDVTNLHEEVSVLRRRADEALEQKMQYENNLSGVKMALDRAEQETRSLRDLLGTNSPQAPRGLSPSSSMSSGLGIQLDEAEHEDAESMIKVLRRSITMAEVERDAAFHEAEAYRVRARALQESEVEHFDREQEMARELLQSAARMEELAAQVQSHLSSNMALRERLSKAVGAGEREQSSSTQKVVQMQSRLRAMEESVLQAQQESESHLTAHEEETKRIEDSCASPQLHRLRIAIPAAKGERSPGSIFSAGFGKSPKIGGNLTSGSSNSGRAETLMESSKTRELENKVRELEAALREADTEMQGVVQRIEKSTFEIAELQGERDDATRQMRKLQSAIESEKAKAQKLMG